MGSNVKKSVKKFRGKEEQVQGSLWVPWNHLNMVPATGFLTSHLFPPGYFKTFKAMCF